MRRSGDPARYGRRGPTRCLTLELSKNRTLPPADCKSTAIGENRRQFAVNCKWEGSVLPNAAGKIGDPRYRPEPPFGMSQEPMGHFLGQT